MQALSICIYLYICIFQEVLLEDLGHECGAEVLGLSGKELEDLQICEEGTQITVTSV